jgi:glycosyltransferase involved in cell wall biosynthesis
MKNFTSQEINDFISTPSFDEKVILNKDGFKPQNLIVTTSFNQAEFLERTILSILNQGYQNLEYIIIDSSSTGGSVGIIKKYEKYFAYWISATDKGQADAINKGSKKSTGEILAWLNSDDVDNRGSIGLATVAKHARGKGIGRVLLADADKKFVEKVFSFVQVVTQKKSWSMQII